MDPKKKPPKLGPKKTAPPSSSAAPKQAQTNATKIPGTEAAAAKPIKPTPAQSKKAIPRPLPKQSNAPPPASTPSQTRKPSTPTQPVTATTKRKPSLASPKDSAPTTKSDAGPAPSTAPRPSTATRKRSTQAVKPVSSPAPPLAPRPSIAPRKASTSAVKPSSANAKPNPVKLPSKEKDKAAPPSTQASNPSLIQRKSSAPSLKPGPTGVKQKGTKDEDDGSPAHKVAEKERDLKSFLSESQRADLTLLIASIAEHMRKTIEHNFDASATLKDLGQEDVSEEDRIANMDFDPGTVDVSEYDKERKAREEREKELATPKVKEMKKTALQWFDEWREVVIQRVGEAVNSKETASEQQMEASSQHKTTTIPKTGGRPIQKIDNSAKSGQYKPPKLEELFPRVQTPLTKLPISKRRLVLHSILLILLSLEHYNAASRVLLLYITSSLKLGINYLREDEERTAKGLLEVAKQVTADEAALKRASEDSEYSRKWKIRLATVAGAAVVGLSGGMAAPMMAAGVGSVMTGLGLGATAAADYLGAVAGSSYVVGSLFGAYGGRMTGEMMQNISAEVHDFAFLPVHGERKEHEESIEAVTDTRRLRVTIAISGWLLEKEEVITPWRVLKPSAEVFALRFELEALMNLGQSIDTMVSSAAYGYAQSAMIKRTVFAEMMSAMWPMAIVKVARVVDNPFSLAKTRADKAGVVLANLLIEKAQGERPVTLVGYSLGARVIWSCLTSLAERKAFGLVESAILIGSPTPSDVASWRVMRTAVSGRLVNVYSEKDLILAFLYRTSSIQYGVAGLMPVSGLLGVENVDVSETVNGHLKYRYLVGSILQKVGFEDVDKTEVAKEAEAFERIVEEEKKHGYVEQAGEVYAKAKGKGLGKELYNKYGKRIGKDGKQLSGKEVSDADADKQLYAMEKEVQQKTQTGLYQWAVEQLYLSRPSVPSTGDAPNPQGAATGATKTADKTADAATKSLYQRAKEATYLSRSGGVEGQHVAKDKLARAQTTTSSAVSTSYLATAAGYIPTGYLPGFGAAGKGTKALGDAGDQAGKLQKDAGKANKPRMKKIDSARKSIGDTAEHVLKRTESAQKKLAGATKDPSQAATDVKNKAQDNTRDPLTTMSRTASGAQKQVDDTAKEASDVAAGTRQAVEVAAKDPTGVAEKGQKQVGEFAETAQKAAGGVTSYIPSFGLRGSAKSIKPAPPKRLASGRSKSTMTVDKTSAGASKSPSTTKAHEKISAASKGTPDQKKAAGYSSYIPYFGSKAASPAQPKDGPNDTSQKTESADDDAEGISKDIAKEAESTADDAKEAPQEIAENIQPAGEGAQKAASDGTSTANDMVSEASESTAGPTSAPSNIGVTLSGAASSATETPSKAGASISNAAAGAQKYMPNSQGLGGDAGSKLGDVAGGAASGVTAGASSLGKSVGSAAQFVGGAQSKRGEMTQNASDAAGQAVDENIGSEEGDHGLDKEYDTTASRLLGERNTDKMIGGAISDVAISDAGKGVAGISRSETGKEKEATESSDDDNVYGDDEDNAVFEDSRSKQTTPQKHGADDPFVDDPDDDADSQSTIKVSQCHDSSSSRSSDAGDEDPEEEEEEEEEEEKEGKGYASTVAGAGKSVVGAGASAGAAGASGVAGGVGMLGRGFGFG